MLPLKNKTVVVTRSKSQAFELISGLEELGAKTISLPLITNSAINKTELSQKIKQCNFSWIIFTSPNAVKFFFETISPKNITSKIAAVGSKTKEHLEALGLNIDFIPTQFTAQQLAKEILVTPNEFFFIPRSNLANDVIVNLLESRNAIVETLSIYENTSVKYSKSEIDNIFKQTVDFTTFTSGSTVNSFIKLGINVQMGEVICIGPETAKIAKENNIPVSAIANPHTIDGMIEQIIVIARDQ
tara:strand:+ start:5405 stop:6133 length:729 start_codon:yes stop_codon:yes gene_type:complete